MATEIEYALMAGGSYVDTRTPNNRFPTPQNWLSFNHQARESGFEAISFTNGSEIVISYAGTYPTSAADQAANVALWSGVGSPQLWQAAEYYLQVKAANPGATITLTGHSLGGGLAALIGVFFGHPAHTFDKAPFANSAEFGYPDVATVLRNELAGKLDANGNRVYNDAALSGLTSYLQLRNSNGGIPNIGLVTNINVQGEFLSVAPWTLADRIVTSGNNTFILNSANGVSAFDLHAQALLAAFLQSKQTAPTNKAFNDATFKLPDLLKMVFDDQLFDRPSDKANPSLLEHLVRHEAGIPGSFVADAMLTRFTTDLWKVAQDGGLTLNNPLISNTLIAFAMQKYYEELPSGTDYKKALFTDVSGGVTFDFGVVAALPSQAKGYTQYFYDYIYSTAFSAIERQLIHITLPGIRDWYVQAGGVSMNAVDNQNRGAFMLGGNGGDILTGGSDIDLLIGNEGADTLKGGSGEDVLLGGANNDTLEGGKGNDRLEGGLGFDTYIIRAADGNDVIVDADGSGTIKVDVSGVLTTLSVGKKEGYLQGRWLSDDEMRRAA